MILPPSGFLGQYEGTYQLTAEITGAFLPVGDELMLFRQTGKPDRHYPSTRKCPMSFFNPGAPRSRRIFCRNASGEITGFVDRREGRDIGCGDGAIECRQQHVGRI